jgi:hypothetical protein
VKHTSPHPENVIPKRSTQVRPAHSAHDVERLPAGSETAPPSAPPPVVGATVVVAAEEAGDADGGAGGRVPMVSATTVSAEMPQPREAARAAQGGVELGRKLL